MPRERGEVCGDYGSMFYWDGWGSLHCVGACMAPGAEAWVCGAQAAAWANMAQPAAWRQYVHCGCTCNIQYVWMVAGYRAQPQIWSLRSQPTLHRIRRRFPSLQHVYSSASAHGHAGLGPSLGPEIIQLGGQSRRMQAWS